MKLLLIGYLLAVGLLTCSDEQRTYSPPADCNKEATVVDYTGTDGCGLMLELTDGTRLTPLRLVYVQAPTPEEDPMYYYELKVGEKVFISYETTKALDTCMGGTIVFIKCIRPASAG